MKETSEAIVRRLRSPNPDERATGLILIGRERRHDLSGSAVLAMLNDEDEEVRAMAAWSLDLLSSAETIPALLDALYDDSFGVRSNAGWALVHLAQRHVPEMVVPDVIDVLKDRDNPSARQMAYLVLNNIGGAAARTAIRLYWRS